MREVTACIEPDRERQSYVHNDVKVSAGGKVEATGCGRPQVPVFGSSCCRETQDGDCDSCSLSHSHRPARVGQRAAPRPVVHHLAEVTVWESRVTASVTTPSGCHRAL